MVVQNRLLQTLSDVFNQQHRNLSVDRKTIPRSSDFLHLAQLKAQREWFGGIAALEQLLLSIVSESSSWQDDYQGLILCAPTPVLSYPELVLSFPTGVFTPEAFTTLALMPSQLPAAREQQSIVSSVAQLPLLPNDPIANEQFCLVFTSKFALVMVLGKDEIDIPAYHFSFDPEIIQQIWLILRARLLLTKYRQLDRLDTLIEEFAPPIPDYRLVTNFSHQLLKHLPDLTTLALRKTNSIEARHTVKSDTVSSPEIDRHHSIKHEKLPSQQLPLDATVSNFFEMDLLQALTHEIRTPLTTIRTLTRLLLKRNHFEADIVKRLETIDQECSEQINRMELIFRAVELETTPPKQKQLHLVSISLEQILAVVIPRWQKQAQRRNVILDVELPQKLPQVLSDPDMLDRALTGLMESVTKSLPPQGQVKVDITTAGHQLKLQLISQCSYPSNPFKSLGQLLMFQPETGNLSLKMEVTKNLFQALGGKLIVRQKSQEGEVMTIFLPLGNPQAYKINS